MTAPTEGVGSLARAGAVLLLVMMTSIFLPGVILQIGAPPNSQQPISSPGLRRIGPCVLLSVGLRGVLADIDHFAGMQRGDCVRLGGADHPIILFRL
jgi:hypothetical protein